MATQPTVSTLTLDGAAVNELSASLRGKLLTSGDGEYDGARHIWNGMIDRRPALIARCRGVADVMAAVRFAREHGLRVSVRGGGHNVAGTAVCEGGLVIDLTHMRGVRVDPERRRVRAEGGALLGDVDHEAQAFGLAVPVGVVSRTGLGGLALHGGMGFLVRKHGLTSDNLRSADVVTADGRLLTADEDNHADLFWALRGGGGNFGVVTSFEFEAYPVGPDVWVQLAVYPLEKAPKVLRFFDEFMAEAPDEVMALAILWSAPTEEPMPEAYRGAPVAILGGCYCGALDEGERVLRPFREVGTPLAELLSGPLPYLQAQQIFDADYPDGRRYYWKSIYFSELSDEVIGLLERHTVERPSPLSSIDVWGLGGASARVDPAATAFAERSTPYLLGIEANWLDASEDEANIAWARAVYRDMRRLSSKGAYLNFPGFSGEESSLVERSYGGNYERLQAVKATYDPENFFSHNLNVRPKS